MNENRRSIVERTQQLEKALALLENGVNVIDPHRFDQRGTLECGTNVMIDINCIFNGNVELGSFVRIGAGCIITDSQVGDGTVIEPYSVINGAVIGKNVRVGPFAHLRPGADLGNEVHIGNFVEVKNSTLRAGAKANHLAYLGDAEVGERVNFGAGSITANYDGVNKHKTVIGNDVLVGSNCVLVAPCEIGDGATIGGGSTITKSAPAGKLTVARARQVQVESWTRPKKNDAK